MSSSSTFLKNFRCQSIPLFASPIQTASSLERQTPASQSSASAISNLISIPFRFTQKFRRIPSGRSFAPSTTQRSEEQHSKNRKDKEEQKKKTPLLQKIQKIAERSGEQEGVEEQKKIRRTEKVKKSSCRRKAHIPLPSQRSMLVSGDNRNNKREQLEKP